MTIFEGKGICDAVAMGKISVIRKQKKEIERKNITDTESEIKRLENAENEVLSELETIREKAVGKVGEEGAAIFEIHKMMIEDEDYNDFISNMIRNEKVSAEYAVFSASKKFSELFSSMENAYMKSRATDIKEISERLINHLSGENENITDGEQVIICAEDLSPGETILLDKEKILSFVTAKGSLNSHTAILAKSMNIPAVVNVGDEFLSLIKNGDYAIADGFSGKFILNPDEETVLCYKKKADEYKEKNALLLSLKGKENKTIDGRRIDVFANIGNAESIKEVKENDADGIGLFRSEFIFLGRDDFPSEEEQFFVYKKIAEEMNGRKVIIRTLDIGADKQADYFGITDEENPALGLRGIRLCLSRKDVFKTQLRALYRASVFGNINIMFPMITSEKEVDEILSLCEDVRKELRKEEIPFNEKTELGIMIETPAAAIISDDLAKKVSFFSIGTNDLIQYTLACDRQNLSVEKFCDTHHKAVLKLIKMTIENAHKNGIWVGICGELAADISLTETFIKMGVDELSVSPPYVLKLREKIRNIDLSK
ncbi:MAG: phosphoenolpyruvate--protein phosphotransferase [Oscillospiraceae bacterium]|nr:phosphoenolpyruvate--protein phosphotransferase [Oscillospiraceae bacterium]